MKTEARNTAKMLLTAVLAILLMLTGMTAVAETSYADTDYTILVYSGKEGYFGDPEVTVKKISGLKYGESVTVDLSEYDLKISDSEKYYVRGLKIAGHDNDELASMQLQSYTFTVTEDMAFAVSYGIAGGMVKYIVKHQDRSGKKLRKDEELYGMPGDKPVVAYRIIKGYIPDTNNLTKTLTDNEEDNVFTFTYRKEPVEKSGSSSSGSSSGSGSGSKASSRKSGSSTGSSGSRVSSGYNLQNAWGTTAGVNDEPGSEITDLDEEGEDAGSESADASDPGKAAAEDGKSGGANAGLTAGIVGGAV